MITSKPTRVFLIPLLIGITEIDSFADYDDLLKLSIMLCKKEDIAKLIVCLLVKTFPIYFNRSNVNGFLLSSLLEHYCVE